VLRMRSRFLLACVFISVCASPGPTADAQQTRALNHEFRLHENFHSKFLKKDRDVIVWLPPGYDSEPAKRYPVLYMHDGASVFVLWPYHRHGS
jgi:enterochelin esterase-like enzyme